MIKFVDLFAGIGGMRLGCEKALSDLGIDTECVLSSEIDKPACKVYEANFGDNPFGDIQDIDESKISDFDLLLAGFPCQPFSYAGHKKGFADTRGTLFFDIERILKKKKPKFLLLENVRGLVSHDRGKTLKTIENSLRELGYDIKTLIVNSSNFGVPQNRVRLFILGQYKKKIITTIESSLGAKDTHSFDLNNKQTDFFLETNIRTVADILEENPPTSFDCDPSFTRSVASAIGGDLSDIHGYRLIDYRGGKSLHSWDLGTKAKCNRAERDFMNLLIQNRRKKKFGSHQDGKMLSKEQILTFYQGKDFDKITKSLIGKGYLKQVEGHFNPVCGNMSFEVFKFLDPNKISITLTSSDCGRLGVYHNKRLRRITPREVARLQGFPDEFILAQEDKHSYRQFGNSVSVPVVSNIVMDIIKNNYL